MPNITKSNHTKTRTGCRTCKVRRIKCDEGKPACRRCLTTGRTCDGYDAPGVRGWIILAGPSPTSPTESPGLEDDAARLCFEYFCSVTAKELSRYFGASFWCRSLLAASRHFDAVRSAVLSVASLHRSLRESASDPRGKPIFGRPPLHNHFAVKKYDNALKQLIRDINGPEEAHSRVLSLVCGALFTIIEVLLGYEERAAIHLDGIVRLLNKVACSEPDKVNEVLVTDIEEDLRPVIARFDVGASIFATWRPPGLRLPTLRIGNDQVSLHDLHDAASTLNDLMMHTSHFMKTVAGIYRYDITENIPLDVLHQQHQLLTQYCAWWDEAKDLFDTSKEATVLQVHYHASWTMLHGALHAEETLYDQFFENFAHIVQLSTKLNESSKGWQAFSFSADTGVVFPLYWTALKCRDSKTRRLALEQLRLCSREGPWIPEIQVAVATQVIAAEELTMSGGSGEYSMSEVLEQHRAHCVGIDVYKERQMVRVEYTRRPNGQDGDWDFVREWLSF